MKSYYQEEIVSGQIVDKVVLLECIALFPNPVVSISAIDMRIDQLENVKFYIVRYENFTALFKPCLTNIFDYPIEENIVSGHISKVLKNQPVVPRTGYRTDTWNAILYGDREVEILNITDTLERYNNEPGSLDRVHAKIFPNLE
ncbi:hypothetical protein [Neolewinella sp.]|uniref:hypothetical protein n=1 Tax=Neolewinella sp. TaxID=2993543 RepID=UPI003B5288A0